MVRVSKFLAFALCIFVLLPICADAAEIKMSYNGPADPENNAVHYFASEFSKRVESATEGRVKFQLFSDSQLGSEEERMELLMKSGLNQPIADISSFAGIAPVLPEIYASSVPFMFDSYRAAHEFFDRGEYWAKLKDLFRERTGGVLIEAVEEGGFLAFTNSKKPIHSPDDFSGLKFRGMDEGQVTIFKSFGASGTPIPWSELYMALKTGVVDGQMNPAMYIIIGSLFEVQKYMTLANIQYSDQFLVMNGDVYDALSEADKQSVLKAAREANALTREKIESEDSTQIEYLKTKGMEVYAPTEEEMNKFRSLGQPGYTEWLKSKVSEEWIELAKKDAEAANKKTSKSAE